MASSTNLKNKHQFRALGTDIYLEVVADDPGNLEKLWVEIENLYFQMEKIFSRFDPESELSILNQSLGEWMEVSQDLSVAAQRAIGYYRRSGKLFDPRILPVLENIGYDRSFEKIGKNRREKNVPQHLFSRDLEEDITIEGNRIKINSRLDFSGMAKGYITDCVAEVIIRNGLKNFIVDSGGDMRIGGLSGKGKKWMIDFEGFPFHKAALSITDCGLATSGVTRRKWEIGGKKVHHIINPEATDLFSFNIQSVTAIVRNAEEADVMAKVLFLMGKEEGIKYADKNRIPSFFLDSGGNLIASKRGREFMSTV